MYDYSSAFSLKMLLLLPTQKLLITTLEIMHAAPNISDNVKSTLSFKKLTLELEDNARMDYEGM